MWRWSPTAASGASVAAPAGDTCGWEESLGDRINHIRTDHFLGTGAATVGVSCPFCLQMLTEGIEARGEKGGKQAKDLLELLAESLEPAPE